MRKSTIKDKFGHFDWQLYFNELVFFFIIVLLFTFPVPSGNEYRYLQVPLTLYDPQYLKNSWILTESWRSHYFFDLMIGFFIHLTSIEAVGWTGRILCWLLLTHGLFKIGQSLNLKPFLTTMALLLWLVSGQALLGGAWFFGGVEAKCVSYILILIGLVKFARNHDKIGSVLFGLAFSLHPSVGAFAILGLGCTTLSNGYRIKRIVTIIVVTFIFCIPGLWLTIPDMLGSNFLSVEDCEFLVTALMPWHLDPMSWPKRVVVGQLLIFLFCVSYGSINLSNIVRFYVQFIIFLFLFFLVGLLAYSTDSYGLLLTMPFRLFPIFSLLFFFFLLVHAVQNGLNTTKRLKMSIQFITILSLMCLSNPLSSFTDLFHARLRSWSSPDDIAKSCIWISNNTMNGVTIISPPWRRDTMYLTKRAQTMSTVSFFPYDSRFSEWTKRMKIIGGDHKVYSNDDDSVEKFYLALSESALRTIVQDFGGDYLIHSGDFTFPVLYDSGTYKVYDLGNLEEN